METSEITNPLRLAPHMQRAAKAAFAVGAKVRVNSEGESLLAQFDDSDSYHFDPENITLHMLELLTACRSRGFVTPGPNGVLVRTSLVVRTVYSAPDVRVQIGASRWYVSTHSNTGHALRHAVVDAFATYYDEVVAHYVNRT